MSASDDPAPPAGVRPPVQERSRRTLDRIARAALELMAERGVEGASVHDIVERAGSSVGSFYARFEGKDDLVLYLEDRVWSAARERWDEGLAAGSWAGAGLPDLVRGLVELVLRVERTDARRRRALGAPGRGPKPHGDASSEGPDGPPAGADAFRRHIARDVRELLLAHRDDIRHPHPERAVETVLPVLIGAARELEGGAPEEVVELTRMVLAYLGSPAAVSEAGPDPGAEAPAGEDRPSDAEAETEEPGGVDFFDVWE